MSRSFFKKSSAVPVSYDYLLNVLCYDVFFC